MLVRGPDPGRHAQRVPEGLRDGRPDLVVVPGEVVELRRGQEVVGENGAREVRVGEAGGDGDEGREGTREVLEGREEGWVEFLVLLCRVGFDVDGVPRLLQFGWLWLLLLGDAGWRRWRRRRWWNVLKWIRWLFKLDG